MRWRRSLDLEPPGLESFTLDSYGAERSNAKKARLTHAAVATASCLVFLAVALWSLIVFGTTLVFGATPGAQALSSRGASAQPILDITHLPPLLTIADDHLNTLRYDIACTEPASESDSSCDIDGTAYVRAGTSGTFRALPLHLDTTAAVGRYTAFLPTDIATAPTGFTYYAIVRDRHSGATMTVPAGGAAAPQRSLRLASPISVDLGAHQFGAGRQATARVATAHWGSGPADVGIEGGPQAEPIGASSFDVDGSGNVTVLDEAHKRLLRFASGAASTPTAIAVEVRGTIADLVVRPDGGTTVLESVAEPGQTPLLRSFDAAGRQTGTGHAAEALVGTLRRGPTGLQALEYPASQWMPITADAGEASAATQSAQGRSGRAVAGGQELVAQREGNEARVALVGSAGVVKSWRVQSPTPLAEIQLAEPLGRPLGGPLGAPLANRVIVVLRTYTEADAAFDVLVLGNAGLEQRFSVDPSDWAETAPLSRFRLVGSSLYHLGSTPTDMFVDRFDLEVH